MQDKNYNTSKSSIQIDPSIQLDGIYDIDKNCSNCNSFSYNKPITFNYYFILVLFILFIK